MKIYSVLQIGDYHINHCEDYLFISQIGNDKIVCAVMDGCTMAVDSYFASTLVGKLLRKITKEKGYKELYGLEDYAGIDLYLKSILASLFKELKAAKNLLLLEVNELLTTLVILLIDKKANEGIALVIGDGFVNIDGNLTEFDQDNKPDYIGFHLAEDFDTWYNKQAQKIAFSNVEEVSIATDGLAMFKPIKNIDAGNTVNPIDFLLFDRSHDNKDDMLDIKMKELEHVHGLKPSDDLAIIRVIF